VTLLWLMQLCERGVSPDIRAAVEDLRMHRMCMVQNLVGNMLLFDHLLELIIKANPFIIIAVIHITRRNYKPRGKQFKTSHTGVCGVKSFYYPVNGPISVLP